MPSTGNETEIKETGELLYRQITPPLFDSKQHCPASSAFGPRPIDNGMPSYARGSIVSAQASRDWHTENAAKPSLGVWAVTVSESNSAEIKAYDNWSCLNPKPTDVAPGHCFLDFRGLDKHTEKDCRARLFMAAMARGEIPTIEHTRHAPGSLEGIS